MKVQKVFYPEYINSNYKKKLTNSTRPDYKVENKTLNSIAYSPVMFKGTDFNAVKKLTDTVSNQIYGKK